MNLLFRILLAPVKMIILFVLFLIFMLLFTFISIPLDLICEHKKSNDFDNWIFNISRPIFNKITNWGNPYKKEK